MKTNTRSTRWFWLAGLLLLGLSTAGAIYTINPLAGAGAQNKDKPAPAAPVAQAGRVVCYGTVDMENGVASLYPSQPGRVVEVRVKENQHVEKDAVLLRMDDRLARFRLQQAEAAVKDAQAKLKEAVELPKKKLAQQQQAVEAAKSRYIQAKNSAQSAETIKQAEAGMHAEEEKLGEIEILAPIKKDEAEAALADRKAQREQAKLAVDECELRAPQAGQVLQVSVAPGQMLSSQPTQPIIIFCPDSTPDNPRIVRAEVEQEFVSRVGVGQKAQVQDENVGTETWTGKVVRISDWYSRPRSQTQDPFRMSNDVRVIECIVILDPKPGLRIGQKVRVTMGGDGK